MLTEEERDAFNELFHHKLLPPPVQMPGGGEGVAADPAEVTTSAESAPPEVNNNNGYEVLAIFESKEALTPMQNLVLRFSTTLDPWATDRRIVEINILGTTGEQAGWRSEKNTRWTPFQAREGEDYPKKPAAGWPTTDSWTAIAVKPNSPGSNRVYVAVRGDQARIEFNGVVIGFLRYPLWAEVTNVFAIPDEKGGVPAENKMYDYIVQKGKVLTSLSTKRYIPGWVWALFGISGGLFLVSSFSRAAAK